MSFRELFQRQLPAADGVAAAPACRSESKNGVPTRRKQEEPPHKKRRDHQQTRAGDAVVDLSSRRHVAAGEHAGEHAERQQLPRHLLGGGNNGANRRRDGQKKLHQRGRRVPRGGGHGFRVLGQRAEARGKRSMTQEFKEQNALVVDGRLLCRHFLWGRCIKGKGCQLEHVQGSNDLIRELCKFYVQGFCSKGSACPYMHKSFPCKYFHRKGVCSGGDACKFSHEPLNDVTTKLLDEAIKRDLEQRELAQKAEEASREPSKEPIPSETERSSGIALLPIRPRFYSSMSTNVESEGPFGSSEEQADAVSGAAAPASPPSPPQNPPQPVCYSVEAVLGPQLSRPFSGFYAASGPKDLDRLSSSAAPPNDPSAGEALPSARTSALSEPRPVVHANLGRDAVGETESCLSEVHTQPDSERPLGLLLNPGELWRPGPETEHPQLPLQAFPEAACERFSSERRSVTSGSDSVPRSGRSGPAESSHPRNHLTLAQKPEESQQELRFGSEEPFSPKNPAEPSDASGAGRKRSLRKPFHCLFARPLTEFLKASHQPELVKSSPASHLNPNPNPSSSFSSLFAAPFGAAAAPPGPASLHSHQREGGQTQAVLSRPAPEDQPTPQNLSPDPRSGPEGRRGADEAQPDVSAPTASSVLKTLFCSLKSYQQDDEENQHVPSGASDHL